MKLHNNIGSDISTGYSFFLEDLMNFHQLKGWLRRSIGQYFEKSQQVLSHSFSIEATLTRPKQRLWHFSGDWQPVKLLQTLSCVRSLKNLISIG